MQDRKKGVTKSKMQGVDILSVLLESPDMFNDESIVDNLIGFMFAATETSQFASQTSISHLTQCPETLKKVREEYKRLVYQPAIEEDPSLADLPQREFLDQVLTMDTA